MKISEQWLREWVAPKLDTKALAERLTMAGLEVGAIEPAAPRLEHVVVGEIRSVAPHPSADKLTLCRVAVGNGADLDIVCGAVNAAAGIKAPVALPGARLPGGAAIQKTEIRGAPSAGMLCSAADLGLEESSAGLMALGPEAKPGTPLEKYLALDDSILEIDLTSNRGDCLSVAGIAREVAALTGAKLKAPKIKGIPARSRRQIKVVLDAPQDCPHYLGRVIESINARAVTPDWMKERLRRAGVRGIHPVVDVTNYVMLELGQPMHAFDLEKLQGAVHVRQARKGESVTLLDGKRLLLDAGALLIADDRAPLALAGIMGGADSAVSAATRHVFLESAWFRPETISARARALGLQTESSQRFERGVDPSLQRAAVERATALLLEIAGGKPGPVIERAAARHLPKRRPITLRRTRLTQMLGVELPPKEVGVILARLVMRTTKTAQGWRVAPPAYRFDIGREIDLIEEVARLHGYEKLPSRRPRIEMASGPVSETRVSAARLQALLADRDYQEVVTYSFIDPALHALIAPHTEALRLANPISADMAVMRTSLWPGLLQAMIYNQNRQQTRLRLFEIGRCFAARARAVDQDKMLAGAVCGTVLAEQWGVKGRAVNFHDAKADVEALLGLGGSRDELRFHPATHPALHPGQTAVVERRGEPAGVVGLLLPEIQAKIGLNQPVCLFELKLSVLGAAKIPIFHELSRFPSIRRDIAVIVSEKTPAQDVLDCITKVAGNLLVNLQLFDEYRGEGIDSGRKSLALGLTLQDSSRTLKDVEVEAMVQGVVVALESELGAQLRR